MFSWLALSVAWAAPCETVSVSELAEVSAPAILLLGERHGHRGDLRRANAVVDALAARGPVVVGLEAVHGDHQAVLDALSEAPMDDAALQEALRWGETWGYDFAPYASLVRRSGTLAAGLSLGPAQGEVEVPPGYAEDMVEVVTAHGMPAEAAESFAVSMAWRDLRIGQQALEKWSGVGVLVIVAGRGHVEGTKATPWQLQRLTDVPIHTAILGRRGAACASGDRIVRGMK